MGEKNKWTNQGGKETEGRHDEWRLFDSVGNERRAFAILIAAEIPDRCNIKTWSQLVFRAPRVT